MSFTPITNRNDVRCKAECVSEFVQGGQRVFYCLHSSECRDDPIWQAIVIPAVLFLIGLILLIIFLCIICRKKEEPMKITNFAAHEM